MKPTTIEIAILIIKIVSHSQQAGKKVYHVFKS